MRPILFMLGWLLLLLAPLVGLLPGPGGIFVAAAGLALLLQTSAWARRLYARLCRRWPRAGALMDRALRRPSARRRHLRDRRGPTSAAMPAAPAVSPDASPALSPALSKAGAD